MRLSREQRKLQPVGCVLPPPSQSISRKGHILMNQEFSHLLNNLHRASVALAVVLMAILE